MAGKKTLGWLHLTDLHCGQKGEVGRLPKIEKAFLDDLVKVLRKQRLVIGLVFFSGDLGYRGEDGDFIQATAFLGRILARIEAENTRHGASADDATPILLPVPGNHDLTRPDAAGREVLTRNLGTRKPGEPALSATAMTEVQEVLDEAFAGYERWLTHELPFPPACSDGVFPGDRVATVNRLGISVGVLCVNGAYLHTGDDCAGKLHVDQTQVNALCPDLASWKGGRDFTVLMTHHPPTWFGDTGREVIEGETLGDPAVDVYLFGHEHPGGHEAQPSTSGVRHLLKGRSLFAAEEEGLERLHGYTVGKFVIERNRRRIEFRPRRGWNHGGWRFGPVEDDGPGDWRVTIDLGSVPEARRDAASPSTRIRWNRDLGDLSEAAKARWSRRFDQLDPVPGRDRWIFLSGSLPRANLSRSRRDANASALKTMRKEVVEDTVRRLARAAEAAGMGIVYGGAPAITQALAPLALDPSRQADPWLILFQHASFWDSFVQDVGVIAWMDGVGAVLVPETPGGADEDTELAAMRDPMVAVDGIEAAVFVGGLDGIRGEYDKVCQRDDVLRFAVGAGGGEAAEILMEKGQEAAGGDPANVGPLWHSPEKAVEAIMKALSAPATP